MDDLLFNLYLQPTEVSQGSTCTAVIIDQVQKKIFVANLGDSRTLLIKNGENAFQTMDHKPSVIPEFERIKKAGGCVINNRVQGQLAVSRAFGDFNLKARLVDQRWYPFNPNQLQLVSVEPDVNVVDFGDWLVDEKNEPNFNKSFIILACDGLFDVCSSFNACEIVKLRWKQLEQEKLVEKRLKMAEQRSENVTYSENFEISIPLESISSHLVQYAYDNKSFDNISVMIVQL